MPRLAPSARAPILAMLKGQKWLLTLSESRLNNRDDYATLFVSLIPLSAIRFLCAALAFSSFMLSRYHFHLGSLLSSLKHFLHSLWAGLCTLLAPMIDWNPCICWVPYTQLSFTSGESLRSYPDVFIFSLHFLFVAFLSWGILDGFGSCEITYFLLVIRLLG